MIACNKYLDPFLLWKPKAMSVLHLIHMNCMKWHKYIDEVMVFQKIGRLLFAILLCCQNSAANSACLGSGHCSQKKNQILLPIKMLKPQPPTIVQSSERHYSRKVLYEPLQCCKSLRKNWEGDFLTKNGPTLRPALRVWQMISGCFWPFKVCLQQLFVGPLLFM